MVGLGSLQSRQMRRTERSGAKAVCWGLGGEARGKGLGYIIEGAKETKGTTADIDALLIHSYDSVFTRSRALSAIGTYIDTSLLT